jgi:hypothetical protein
LDTPLPDDSAGGSGGIVTSAKQIALQGVWRAIASTLSDQLGLDRFRDHALKQDFDGHRMSTTVVSDKEFAVAGIGTVVEGNMVIVVITVKGKVEFIEDKAIALLRISPGFFSLADQSVVHCHFSFQDLK